MLVMRRDSNKPRAAWNRRTGSLARARRTWLDVSVTQELAIPLAVEKVLFRLALLEGGTVPIVRAFLELPLALEVLEHEADKCSDGAAILKDEWGEFLGYSF